MQDPARGETTLATLSASVQWTQVLRSFRFDAFDPDYPFVRGSTIQVYSIYCGVLHGHTNGLKWQLLAHHASRPPRLVPRQGGWAQWAW